MLCDATSAPVAMPNLIARSTAPRFNTGSVPGSAKSMTLACEFGSEPKWVDAPEKILLAVVSCACVSIPMTTSHCMVSPAIRSNLGCAFRPFHWTLVQRGDCTLVQQPSRFALFVTVCVPRCLRHRSVLARLGRLLHDLERGGHVFMHNRSNVGGCRFIQPS